MNWIIQTVGIVSLTALSFFYGYIFAQHHPGSIDCSQASQHIASVPVAISKKSDTSSPPKPTAGNFKSSSPDVLELSVVINRNPRKPKDDVLTYENTNPLVLEEVFDMYHHPSHPSISELLLRKQSRLAQLQSPNSPDTSPYEACDYVYLTRTGSLANMPNKCMALALVPDHMGDLVPHYHRVGKISGLENMYQGDFIDKGAMRTENMLLPDFLNGYEEIVAQVKELMGDRKEIVVMVLNEGVLDVFLNWVCSLKKSEPAQNHILDQLIVFAGQASLVPLMTALGVKALHHKGLGQIPAKAAAFYGDMTFAYLMWLKSTAVLVSTAAGYSVLFQDVDLVWLHDPLPTIRAEIARYESIAETKGQKDYIVPDVYFMDDGARTPRFTPLYVNSGFYYVRPTTQSVYVFLRIVMSISQIAVSHSHQSVLTRQVHEAIDLFGLRFAVLDMKIFPSGFHYHHEKKYMESLRAFETRPDVFHMCWTESRVQKVDFLTKLGMWFLPTDNTTDLYAHCGTVSALKTSLAGGSVVAGNKVYDRCCQRGDYWTKRSAYDVAHPISP